MVSEWLRTRPTFDLDRDVPEAERGEWLGAMYASAVEALDLAALTTYPVAGTIVAAKVLAIEVLHPAPGLHVVHLEIDADGNRATVVCGGTDYHVGDLVAFDGSVAPRLMHGVTSRGIMLASTELGLLPQAKLPASTENASAGNTSAEKAGKKKTGAAGEAEASKRRIHVLPPGLPLGVPLVQLGRRLPLDAAQVVQAELDRSFHLLIQPATDQVLAEHTRRHQAVKDTLKALEAAAPDDPLVALWAKTKAWSLAEFERIYAWLGARFDVRFYESECSEPSRALVNDPQWRTGADPVFVASDGALGADLASHGLGFALVLKRDGTGLYATKDLALARIKFDKYAVDQSIYIVDAAQTLHFKQVFKILERMGYAQAAKCLHVAYGQVRGNTRRFAHSFPPFTPQPFL
jgi:tRNA-binding EMAP/Myf-like protein